ncbi:MAG: NADH-quinone oxidoreductase subunit A [Epsilonproteobacteria bacterium]|nr:MAG: NADH-quinone oxidoreductase subunit A [Campylobacterota bacterium]RLA65730.1 MAG: NADH-quinone oxidoreductase subunit A [Campylobacterota bacterium]
MSMSNLDIYMPILMLLLLGVLLVGITVVLISKVVRPHNPNPVKEQAYECGEDPVGSAWSLFNMRFYVTGLIFIIFDVESALMFPVVAVFKSMNEIGLGGLVLIELIIFITILVAGLAYCWRKGDLDWVKSYKMSEDSKEGTGIEND